MHTHIRRNIRAQHQCTYIHTYIHTCVHTCMHTHIRRNIRARNQCTHTHIHTCIHICIPTSAGTYALDVSVYGMKPFASECLPCPIGAECAGGVDVSPKEGYWMLGNMICSDQVCAEDGYCDPLKCFDGLPLQDGNATSQPSTPLGTRRSHHRVPELDSQYDALMRVYAHRDSVAQGDYYFPLLNARAGSSEYMGRGREFDYLHTASLGDMYTQSRRREANGSSDFSGGLMLACANATKSRCLQRSIVLPCQSKAACQQGGVCAPGHYGMYMCMSVCMRT
jgi:hypothetical protein